MNGLQPIEVTHETALSEELDPSYLTGRIDQISEITAELIDDIHLDNLIDLHSGDFTKRICFKSGNLLEQRNRKYITQAFNIWGEENAIEFLQQENIANCALHWVHTNPSALDKLMLHDPVGYAVYGMAYVLANHSPLAGLMVKHTKEQSIEWKLARFAWALQKYELNKILSNLPLHTIVELNERLRIYLTVFEATQLPQKYDLFAQLYVAGDREYTEILIAAGSNLSTFLYYMNETLWSVLRAEENKGHISFKQNYDHIYKLREKFGGYSNFAGQLRPRGQSNTDAIGAIMREEMKKAGIIDTESYLRFAENSTDTLQVWNKKVVSVPRGQVIAKVFKPGQKMAFGFAKPIEPVAATEEVLQTISEGEQNG